MLDRTEARADAHALDLGRLQRTLGFMIRMSQLQLYAEFFRAAPNFELRLGVFSMLTLIACNPGQRQGQIAETLRIRQPHMTKLVRKLEAQGLIERRVPRADRRSVELRLTPQGEAEVARHWAMIDKVEETPSRLDAAETGELMRLLQKLTGLGTKEIASDRSPGSVATAGAGPLA